MLLSIVLTDVVLEADWGHPANTAYLLLRDLSILPRERIGRSSCLTGGCHFNYIVIIIIYSHGVATSVHTTSSVSVLLR
jgi:hypothetical protein